MKKKIVFDIDDTLWPLNNRVSKLSGIPMEKLYAFDFNKNALLTDNEKNTLLNYYTSTYIFDNINWFDGIERILKLNADVYINSNYYKQSIADTKRIQLRKLGFDDAHIQLNYIDVKSKGIKNISDDVFIFIDDSPYNMAASKAKYNITLAMPWNTSDDGKAIIGDKDIIYCNSLNEIIDTIEQLLKEENIMSLNEILDNITYDLTFANGITLRGNMEYVSQHFGDDLVVSNVISKNQPKCVSAFCESLFNYNDTHNNKLSITDFYNNIWIKEN